MIQYFCDRCGSEIRHLDIRYIMKTELFAAADPLFFTEEDLNKDHRAEMDELIRRMEKMDPEQVNDGVYMKKEFDLCSACRNLVYQQFRKQQLPDLMEINSNN